MIKSVDLVRAYAEEERRKRTSPSRYDRVKSKITHMTSKEFGATGIPEGTASKLTLTENFFSDEKHPVDRLVNRT